MPVDITYRDRNDGAPTRWICLHAEVVETDDAGRPRRVAGSIVDVTEAEAATTHLRTLLDAMVDGYYTLDPYVDLRIREPASRAAAATQRAGRPEHLAGVPRGARTPLPRALRAGHGR